MGVLIRHAGVGLAAVIVAGLAASGPTACAVVPPPRAAPSLAPAIGCAVERGTPEALVLAVEIRATVPDDAVVVLRRDGTDVGQAAVADLPELPFTLRVGDPNTEAGAFIVYECELRSSSEPEQKVTLELVVPDPPGRGPAPELSARERTVAVAWERAEGVWVQVLRRDVLSGGDLEPISPALGQPGWDDDEVEPGGVYAYALRPIVLAGGVTWEGTEGIERYVEVPAE